MDDESKGYLIEKLASDNHMFCELKKDSEDEVKIELSGDWKHEHLRFKLLVQDNFKVKDISSETIGDRDSDYYKAEYTIRF